MDMALFWTERGKKLAAEASSPNIRYFKVGTTAAEKPQPRLRGGWAVAVAPNALNFTEVGYNFALQLQAKLNVPIGVVNSSWGGTAIESWMSSAALDADPAGAAVRERWKQAMAEYPDKLAKYRETKAKWEADKAAAIAAGTPFNKMAPLEPSGPVSQYLPSGLYNAMIGPLMPLRVRGIIWYQGENNTRRPGEYQTLFPSLIQDWRSALGQGDLPFYWVQLPGYNIGSNAADWPGLREAQAMALSIPNTGQAVTVDIGDPKEIHPANKQEVGRRLALLALHRTYGFADVVDSGPVFERAEYLADGSVRVVFDGPVVAGDGEIGGFEMTSDGKSYVKAKAALEAGGKSVVLTAPGISSPTGVRYAWSNNPVGLKLASAAGLPLAPFRSVKP
jgi:sialate O-acetylesterase